MNVQTYKEIVSKASNCALAGYTMQKTQNVLFEQFGRNLEPPKGYKGVTIIEAYMENINVLL
jgi:hypothetical protein